MKRNKYQKHIHKQFNLKIIATASLPIKEKDKNAKLRIFAHLFVNRQFQLKSYRKSAIQLAV